MPKFKAELSIKSQYWLPKHRYYELKHFCLQYPSWKELYFKLRENPYEECERPTEYLGVTLADLSLAMRLVEETAYETDLVLSNYILQAVTQGLSFTQLKVCQGIPCERDMYYTRYRRYFWLLSQAKGV